MKYLPEKTRGKKMVRITRYSSIIESGNEKLLTKI